MECLRNCWFQNPDGDFDIDYASDSSVGLAATDNESPPKDIFQFQVPIYDTDNDSGEVSLLSVVNENAISSKQSGDVQLCNKCAMQKRTIIELRTMLMEERRDDARTMKQLKKKYNELVQKYQEKKKLLQQFATSEANYTQKVENIHNEMQRLANKNHEILKEKHNIQREKEQLITNYLNLQLTMNKNKQIIHQLTIKNENNRKYSTKLLKELNNVKQEHVSFVYKMSNKSMANIHENNNNVWVDFDNGLAAEPAPEPARSDESESAETQISHIDGNYNMDNLNINDLKLLRTHSISIKNAELHSLRSIDEQKENIQFIRNSSISSDGTYDYEDNYNENENEPQFIMRSVSAQSWQQNIYNNYNSFNASSPLNINNKSVSFSQISALDTPISPLTTPGSGGNHAHYRYFEENNLGKIVSVGPGPIYFDDDGIDVTDDNDESKELENSENERVKLKRTLSSDNAIKVYLDSGTDANDLDTAQRVQQKLQIVSSENTALKFKNKKLRKEIKELAKQLLLIKNNNGPH